MNLALVFGLFGSVSEAKAAETMIPNIDLARQVINDIKPMLPEINFDEERASLSLVPDGYIAKPLITETKITKVIPQRQTSNVTYIYRRTIANSVNAKQQTIQSGNRFPYGYCTYYVAQRRYVPWSGNAISWLGGAQKFGFAIGNTAQVGAIIVTSEGGRTGHIGIVDAVDGNQITISEMNYQGWGVISSRTISADYGRIMGYIY